MVGAPSRPERTGIWGQERLILITVLVVAVIAYLVVILTVIAPSQGGTISSTELMKENLTNTDPRFTEALPLQDVGLGASGRSIFIAFVMETHVLFANLQLGGSIIIVATLIFFLRNGMKRYQNLARSLTLFNLILFSTGATFAGAGVFFFISLFPTFASNAFHAYWWPLLAEAILFGLEIFVLYAFWFAWTRIKTGWHLALGFAYILVVFFQTLMIDMLAAGMLTPGVETLTFTGPGLLTMPSAETLQLWFNPTLWQLQFHRMGAALAFVGFLTTALAVLHYRNRKGADDRRQWDWVAAYGLVWGIIGLVMQSMLGQVYMLKIMDSQPAAFEMIMHGARAWEMLFMVTLYSALALTVIIYFTTRRDQLLSQRTTGVMRNIFWGFLIIAAVLAFIFVQPAWLGANSVMDPNAWINPLGKMDYKYIALYGIAFMGAAIVMLDTILLTSEEKEGAWGYLTKGSWISGLVAGLLGTAIVNVMGFVREAGRAPWTLYNIIPVSHNTPTPIPPLLIALVWIISIGIAWIIFWNVSKVTAYHPETEERVEIEHRIQTEGSS